MQFVYPAFLFALLAVAIPVIIHLFHFRRFRRGYFSDVSFLRQLNDESKKQSSLKHLLVLAFEQLISLIDPKIVFDADRDVKKLKTQRH